MYLFWLSFLLKWRERKNKTTLICPAGVQRITFGRYRSCVLELSVTAKVLYRILFLDKTRINKA